MNDQYRNAIGTVESDNNYGSLGPVTPSGDRAYGRYQVMGNNIPDWTEEHLGRRMTPSEFLADRDAQDKTFDSVTSQYYKKYGNMDDVTSSWFSGRPVSKAGNSSDGYNTVPQYLAKVNRVMDGPTAIDTAMGRTRSTGSQRMAFNATDDEENPNGALSSAPPPGALSAGGAAVPAKGNWLDTIGQTMLNMAPGLASISDADRAKALAAIAAAQQKTANAGTWSTSAVDPKSGIAVQTNNKDGSTRTIQVHAPQPEKDPAETAYSTATGKAFADKNQKIADDAVSSHAALSNLDTLRTALTNPDVYQGTGGETVAMLKKAGNGLGMDFKGVADADLAQSLINKLTQESRQLNGGMPGSLSDKDLAFLKAANAGLDKTPEANQRIIDIYAKLHNRNIEMNQERLAYTAGGKQLDEGFNTKLAAKWAAEKAAADAADQAAAKAAPVTPAAAVAPQGLKLPKGVKSIQLIQ